MVPWSHHGRTMIEPWSYHDRSWYCIVPTILGPRHRFLNPFSVLNQILKNLWLSSTISMNDYELIQYRTKLWCISSSEIITRYCIYLMVSKESFFIGFITVRIQIKSFSMTSGFNYSRELLKGSIKVNSNIAVFETQIVGLKKAKCERQ